MVNTNLVTIAKAIGSGWSSHSWLGLLVLQGFATLCVHIRVHVHCVAMYTDMTIALQLHADMHGGMSVMSWQLPVKGWQLGFNIKG